MIPIPNYLPCFSVLKTNIYLHSKEGFFENYLFSKLSWVQKREIAKLLGVSERLVYYYSTGKRKCSLNRMIKIAEYRNLKTFLEDAYRNFSGISTQGHKQSKLQKEYSYELAYLAGFIAGDGHVSKRSEIMFVNDSKDIIHEIIPKFVDFVFGVKLRFRKEGNYYRAVLNSKQIHVFFNKVIGFPAGKKKGSLRVPCFIYLSDEYKIGFLQGLFDSDGGVTLSKGKLSILYSSSTKEFLLQVQALLEGFSVKMGGPYASGGKKGMELRTYSKSQIKMFSDKIRYYHPKKLERINATVAQWRSR